MDGNIQQKSPEEIEKQQAMDQLGKPFKDHILDFLTFSAIKPRFVTYSNAPYFEISMKAYVGNRPGKVFQDHGMQLKKDPREIQGFVCIKDACGVTLATFSDKDFYDPQQP